MTSFFILKERETGLELHSLSKNTDRKGILAPLFAKETPEGSPKI